MNKTWEQEKAEKRVFTKMYIEPLLKRLNKDIINCEYVVATPSNAEYVNIYFKSHYETQAPYRKQVNVSADSLKAMISDILRYIG